MGGLIKLLFKPYNTTYKWKSCKIGPQSQNLQHREYMDGILSKTHEDDYFKLMNFILFPSFSCVSQISSPTEWAQISNNMTHLISLRFY